MLAKLVSAGKNNEVDALVQNLWLGMPREILDLGINLAFDSMNKSQVAVVVPDLPVKGVEIGVRVKPAVFAFPQKADLHSRVSL
ncbi:hypothetical protein [Paracoccus yeei]|uniref:hypothetical protein n=1 Tax=Paracoccus yeei TaxID=147645 RepID=UPI0024325273|nr:hypothetical protein [Paracoccus yeei]